MIKPNWRNSILNVSATLSEFLGNKNDITKIKIIKDKLKCGYKNVVFMCLDGMGIYPLSQNLAQNSFLRSNIKKTITSVFPSTTTNATSTLCSATYPMQHGMFGWSLYLDELERCVDVYLCTDSITGEKVDKEFVKKRFAFDYYFDTCSNGYETSAVFPTYVNHQKNNNAYQSTDEMFNIVKQILNRDGKQFVYCYCGEPDATMHEFGVTSEQTKRVLQDFDEKIKDLSQAHSNTLFIITCDHGHINITDYIELYKDKNLLKTLQRPASLEARAVAFKVKRGCRKAFEKEIKKYKVLKLFKTSYLIKNNYFGPVSSNATLLGDYIAVVTDEHTQVLLNERSERLKGHHTSLTKAEMLLPLIILN